MRGGTLSWRVRLSTAARLRMTVAGWAEEGPELGTFTGTVTG